MFRISRKVSITNVIVLFTFVVLGIYILDQVVETIRIKTNPTVRDSTELVADSLDTRGYDAVGVVARGEGEYMRYTLSFTKSQSYRYRFMHTHQFFFKPGEPLNSEMQVILKKYQVKYIKCVDDSQDTAQLVAYILSSGCYPNAEVVE